MNKQTKEQLRAVLEDEEKTAAFAQKILETIDTDDESYEDIGNSVIYVDSALGINITIYTAIYPCLSFCILDEKMWQ